MSIVPDFLPSTSGLQSSNRGFPHVAILSGLNTRSTSMSQDVTETPASNGEELSSALHGLPPVSSSPLNPESRAAEGALSISALVEQCRQEIGAYRRGEHSNEAFGLELLHRAILQGDQDAWAGLQHCFAETVRGWLHGHPHREVACRLESED